MVCKKSPSADLEGGPSTGLGVPLTENVNKICAIYCMSIVKLFTIYMRSKLASSRKILDPLPSPIPYIKWYIVFMEKGKKFFFFLISRVIFSEHVCLFIQEIINNATALPWKLTQETNTRVVLLVTSQQRKLQR